MAKSNRITVSTALLRAALTFAAVSDVRYYLNGVKVEPSPDGRGVRLIATDGHRLAVLFDADGSADAPAIIERHKLPAIPRKLAHLPVTFDGERAEYPGGTSVPVSYINGVYPDWRAVVPNAAELGAGAATFDADYLADLAAIPPAYGRVKHPPVAIHCRDANSSALATFADLPAFVVLMPLKQVDTVSALPDFMRAGDADRMTLALSVQAVQMESARMALHALANVHPGDARHQEARERLLRHGRAWVAQLRRCKAAGIATVSALPFPPDRCAWPQPGTVAADVHPFAVDAFERFDASNPEALVPAALLGPDGRYSCDGCEAMTDRAALVAMPAGYFCHDCASDHAAPVDDVLPVPAPAIDSAPPVPAPLAAIRATRAEGPMQGVNWPSGETREFTGPAAWSAAHAALASLCHDAPATGGYDKCDISIEWTNGDSYGYRFDAQHPATPGGQGDTPDVARYILDRLHFLEGAARPLHMTAGEYHDCLQSMHAHETAAELRPVLERCAFPLDLTPPVVVDVDPLPVPGRRCWYRGWGPSSQGAGPAIITELDAGNPPQGASAATLARHVRFVVVSLRDNARHSFSLRDLCDVRSPIILGDTMASDLETSSAQRQSLDAIAARDTAAAIAEQQHVDAVAKLKAEHPTLAPASDPNAVGVNLRTLLKAAGIRASVRKERGAMVSSYRIELPASATDAQLAEASAIGARFEAGHFDGMSDCYEYRRTAWTEAFGSVRYVFVNRAWRVDDADPQPPATQASPVTVQPVADMAAYREKVARQRESCATQPTQPPQNARTRARWDAGAGSWVPVHAVG